MIGSLDIGDILAGFKIWLCRHMVEQDGDSSGISEPNATLKQVNRDLRKLTSQHRIIKWLVSMTYKCPNVALHKFR